METQELRIGNFVDTYLGIQSIEELSTEHISCDGTASKFNPIPLTEEWHNAFGVKRNGHLSFVYELPRTNTIKLAVVFNGDYVFLRQGDKPGNYEMVTIWNTDLTKRDMFVHEWQNWYYLLSGGKELTKK